ncbi:uncharacterized protein BDR25DRAFT_361343 [Lindgomyces ingoldianus]|uniref:Uncharacterized protein n=1 Tax=Lindgomyces ingoldianus TaxID=673940 RepID=A0ACB6QD68_9PLEO|nr:uncharacterized protein BDR25DRAFT_361343 [Lindgomyces ingoldianus]KAF2464805.1 hypothetical protein BDR25DRAFT_361343 [Lindgomyces ingoldianus]
MNRFIQSYLTNIYPKVPRICPDPALPPALSLSLTTDAASGTQTPASSVDSDIIQRIDPRLLSDNRRQGQKRLKGNQLDNLEDNRLCRRSSWSSPARAPGLGSWPCRPCPARAAKSYPAWMCLDTPTLQQNGAARRANEANFSSCMTLTPINASRNADAASIVMPLDPLSIFLGSLPLAPNPHQVREALRRCPGRELLAVGVEHVRRPQNPLAVIRLACKISHSL